MKKRVLLSIHPEFAEAIFKGQKRVEFRRVLFKENVDEVLVYATSPVARVIGRFSVGGIYEEDPATLWEKTKSFAGVSKEKFDSYFAGRSTAFGIKVKAPVRFAVPQPLANYASTPPQSFCYV